jgi:phospho-N-acetylmuramoyl-pentapeptide-transferase
VIFLLSDFLKNIWGIKFPAVFEYYSTRMMLALITAFVLTLFLGPRFIKKLYELKIGQTIRTEDCPFLAQLHEKKKDTPTMGGSLLLFSMLVSMLLWMDLSHIFTLILFFTTIVLGYLGATDDYLKLKYKNSKGVSGFKKMFFQGFVAAVIALYLLVPQLSESIAVGKWFQSPVIKEHNASTIASQPASSKEANLANEPYPNNSAGYSIISLQEYASRIYIPFFKDHVFSFNGMLGFLAFLFIISVIMGSSNAVNLTDGLDGLAAGCLIMVASCLAFTAFIANNLDLAKYLNILYVEGSGEVAIYLSALVGVCIGFLWFNGYPAQIIMGDTGSLALGGIIGVSAVLLKREFLLALIGGVFVAETVSVMLQVGSYKLRNKKRIFLCTPLHHHFEYKGWPETKIVVRFWIVSLILAILGLVSLKFQ